MILEFFLLSVIESTLKNAFIGNNSSMLIDRGFSWDISYASKLNENLQDRNKVTRMKGNNGEKKNGGELRNGREGKN